MNSISNLNGTERQSVEQALDEECKAHTPYVQAIRDFGQVRPYRGCANRFPWSSL
jgi:hypothetical protein